MPIWTIRCYKSDSGRNQISEWYNKQSAAVQAEFDSALSYLVDQPRNGWVRPAASKLAGTPCANLHEIRFKADNKQIRPLGYFGPDQNEFTILICVIEKGSNFVPHDACDQAQKRLNKVESDKDQYSCRCFCNNTGCDCC